MLSQRVTGLFEAGWTVEQVYMQLLNEGLTVAQIAEAVETSRRHAAVGGMQSRVVRVVIGIGTALVAAGVFSFVAANWREMADWGRIATILAGMLVFSGAGVYLRDFKRYTITGEAMLVTGTLIYGAGIFLVAQMYNLRGNWPDGIVWWMVGSLAMAAAMRSMSLTWLGALLGVIAAAAYPIGLLGSEPLLNPYVLSSPLMIAFGALVASVAGVLLRASVPERFRDRW